MEKNWVLVSPTGETYEINNLKQWCRENQDLLPCNHKYFYDCIVKVKNGIKANTYGWTFVACVDNRNQKKCIICDKLFFVPPSSGIITCSERCESINRSRNGLSDDNMRKLELAHEAAKKSINIGDCETSVLAKSWVLVSPTGETYEINNLKKWAREHQDLLPNNYKTFCSQLYKVKQGKVSHHHGWTLAGFYEENLAREGLPEIKRHPKRSKMTEEERLAKKRERAKQYYYKKKEQK